MKIKNGQIILVIATFLGVYLLLAGYLSILDKDIIKTDDIKTEKKEIIIENKIAIVDELVESQVSTQIAALPLSEREVIANTIKVSLIVFDKNYELEIKENSSVFEVMKKLQDLKENEFSFKYKEYPGMGVFVYEINGMKGKRGAYWIYYVNDKEASVGVSSYTLSEGDSILWKQE